MNQTNTTTEPSAANELTAAKIENAILRNSLQSIADCKNMPMDRFDAQALTLIAENTLKESKPYNV